jgi:hypothetical protein
MRGHVQGKIPAQRMAQQEHRLSDLTLDEFHDVGHQILKRIGIRCPLRTAVPTQVQRIGMVAEGEGWLIFPR